MTVKIAIFGSANTPEQMDPTERYLSARFGSMIGKVFGSKVQLITGGCIGIPELVANSAREYGTKVVGYSGESNIKDHCNNPNYTNPEHLDDIVFVDPEHKLLRGFTQRSLNMIQDADCGVFIGGRTGTMTEYGAMHDETTKPMYTLKGGAKNFVTRLHKLRINKKRDPEVHHEWRPFYLAQKIDEDFGIADFVNDPQYHIVDYRLATIPGAFRMQYDTLSYPDESKILHRQ